MNQGPLKRIAKQSKISQAVFDVRQGDLQERVTEIERKLVKVTYKLSQTEDIARQVFEKKCQQLYEFMADAQKFAEAFMAQSPQNRHDVNELLRKK